MVGPLDGNAVVLAAAKASVTGPRLLELIQRAQRHLADQQSTYDRAYECIFEDDRQAIYFVEEGHWATVGAALELTEREWKALRRAHREHLQKFGRDVERHEEFDSALDVREVVVIGREAAQDVTTDSDDQ